MSEFKRDLQLLNQLKALPLNVKIRLSYQRIEEALYEYNYNAVVAFSGGKDSTVLLDLVRNVNKNVIALFCDTKLEYPELKEFVLSYEKVDVVRSKYSFRDVITKFGYPIISKTVSHNVKIKKYNPNGNVAKNIFSPEKHGQYAMYKWSKLCEAPFDTSDYCCNIFKKNLAHNYCKKHECISFVGTTTDESKLRRDNWIRYGCNSFNTKNPYSAPLSFWTEQDILEYIYINNIPIAPPYGEIKCVNDCLECTGCKRTGCMFCGFGAHNGDKRFLYLKEHYPKIYENVFKDLELGGLGYAKVLQYCNDNVGTKFIW